MPTVFRADCASDLERLLILRKHQQQPHRCRDDQQNHERASHRRESHRFSDCAISVPGVVVELVRGISRGRRARNKINTEARRNGDTEKTYKNEFSRSSSPCLRTSVLMLVPCPPYPPPPDLRALVAHTPKFA